MIFHDFLHLGALPYKFQNFFLFKTRVFICFLAISYVEKQK